MRCNLLAWCTIIVSIFVEIIQAFFAAAVIFFILQLLFQPIRNILTISLKEYSSDVAMYRNFTIQDVAKKVGVSIATVSRVLNGSGPVKAETRDKILSIVSEYDFKRERSSGNKKVLIASFPELSNPFYSNIIRGISYTANLYSYHVLFCHFDRYAFPESYSFYNDMDFYSGLITCHAAPDYSILKEISEKVPVVMCAEHSDVSFAPYVAIDDKEATYAAMKYLIGTGRKKIGMINSSLRNNYAVHRERAFRKCLKDYGLPINEDWIAHVSDVSFELGQTVVNDILRQSDRPDALFCVSDVFAAAAINAARSLQISVPTNLAVIGFDNDDIASITIPSITTVAQPTYQIGVQACKLLIEQIEYPNVPQRHIILNTELIVREST